MSSKTAFKMSIPDYIRTEWKGRGYATLQFSDANCKSCITEWKNLKTENDTPFCITQEDAEHKKNNSCSHVNNVECYFSTLNVWEYQEDKIEFDEVTTSDEIHEESSTISTSEETSISEAPVPPTIAKETWNEWLQFWFDWKDVYINLIWVKRFRKFCKGDTIEWFEKYCESYPQVLSYVSYCENLPLENEKALFDAYQHDVEHENTEMPQNDSHKEKALDELYKEFSLQRYWVHFQLYLRDLKIETNPELEALFASHGILDHPPEISYTHDEQNENQSSEKETKEIFGNEDSSTGQSNDQIPEVAPINNISCSDEHAESTQSLPSDSSRPDCEESKPSLPILENAELSNCGGKKETTSKDINDSIEVKKKTEKEVSSISEQNQTKSSVSINNIHASGTESTPLSTVNHNSKKKPRASSNIGVAWALKHIQQLGDLKNSQQGSNTFVFGSSQSNSNPIKLPALSTKGEKNASSHTNGTRTQMKRKHDELECETKRKNSTSSQDNEDKKIVLPSSKNPVTRIFRATFDFFRIILNRLSNEFVDSILILFRINPFQRDLNEPRTFTLFPFLGWWSRIFNQKEMEIERKMRSVERNSLRHFKTFFHPTVRVNPRLPLLSGKSHLSKVVKRVDPRETQENLLRVSEEESSVNGESRKGLYVSYLTEEDIDCALVDMAEMHPVIQKENVPVRTHTIFDDEGVPQDVLKVPASDGKLRCTTEEGYYNDVKDTEETIIDFFDEWSETNGDNLSNFKIYFDDEGNPMKIPNDYHRYNLENDALHRKMTKLLSTCRFVRFSRNDVITAPDEIPDEMIKYWCQRFRLFLRYDEGINIDYESWYSITPEMIAAHQAERCACDTVVDAFCGAGGNAIQLAATCNNVIAIDIDPAKIALAKHNARVYGVEDRIQFIIGDFFTLAPHLKADVVMLCPPWGGMEYLKKHSYDIYKLGGLMDGRKLYEAARKISPDFVLYLPKNTNLFQLIELAGPNGRVDIEFNHISNKRKALTAYYGELVEFNCEE